MREITIKVLQISCLVWFLPPIIPNRLQKWKTLRKMLLEMLKQSTQWLIFASVDNCLGAGNKLDEIAVRAKT